MAGNVNKLFLCDLILPTKIHLLLLICLPPEVFQTFSLGGAMHTCRLCEAGAGISSSRLQLPTVTSHENVPFRQTTMHLLEGRIHGFSGWNRMEPWESLVSTTIAYPPIGNE